MDLTRLSRSTKDLFDLVELIEKKGLAAARVRGKKGGRTPKLDLNKKNSMYEFINREKQQ